MIAARVASQPVQPDWPGYLMEVVPFAIVAAIFLLIAVTGIALRAADAHARSTGLAIVAAIVSYGAWIVAMAGAVAGVPDPGVLWATQTVAMVVTAGVGLLVRSADERLGTLVMLAAVRCCCRGPVPGSSSARAGRRSGWSSSWPLLWFDERRRLS